MADPRSKPRDIKTVMEAHAPGLMSLTGVTGVAIGLNRKKKPCILVLVVRATKELKDKVPKEIEGHPVEMMVAGEIRGMTDGKK